MLLIISAHVALIALAMSAKMELTHRPKAPATTIYFPKALPPPPPVDTTVKNTSTSVDPRLAQPNTEMELPLAGGQVLGNDTGPGPIAIGGASFPQQQPPVPIAVRHEARLLTPLSELKPPYPDSKLLSEEEATLQLRLTISESGRVIAVDPIGAADRIFLDAARRYLIAHWRYQPATEDGRAISSTVVISLRFQLDG
jgi:protein TonB